MTEASRFANEYGDLTHLPLFSQTGQRRHTGSPRFRPHGGVAAGSHVRRRLGRWSPTLRAQASEQLSQAVQSDRARLDKEAQQELGRSIVLDLIESAMAEAVDAGHGVVEPREAAGDRPGRVRLAVPARPSPAVGRRRPDREHRHRRPRQRPARAGRRDARARTAGRRLRSGADRLPRLPGIAQRGERSFVLRGPAAPAPEARRRIAPGCGRLGDAASLGRDPASPADAGHARRPRRARDDDAGRRPRSCEPRCALGARSSSPARKVPGRRRWSAPSAPRSTSSRRSAPSRPSTSCTSTSSAATRWSMPGRPGRDRVSGVLTGARRASSPSTRHSSTPSASTSRDRSSARSAARRSGR